MSTSKQRILATAGAAALAFTLAGATVPASAAQALPPRCSIEKSGLSSVKGTCPSGFYWVTVECRDARWTMQNWHQWGDAKARPEMVASCRPWQVRTGGEVFNATTGEKVRL